MLTIIKRENPWVGDAHGHVIDEKYFREFKRKGAEVALMSKEQFGGYFGEREPKNGHTTQYFIDDLLVMEDEKIPPDEVHFHDAEKCIGKIKNLYVPGKNAQSETTK